jgi:hypothetical protein
VLQLLLVVQRVLLLLELLQHGTAASARTKT